MGCFRVVVQCLAQKSPALPKVCKYYSNAELVIINHAVYFLMFFQVLLSGPCVMVSIAFLKLFLK